MTYDLGKAVGFQYRDKPVSWTRKDLITYALGVGATPAQLSLVYELDPAWGPLPTYPVVLSLKGEDTDVSLFASKLGGEALPGFPRLDPKRVVHASQSIQVLEDLPVESGPGWKLTTRVVGVHENGSGIIVEDQSQLVSPQGTAYATLHSSAFYLGSKANGQNFSKTAASAPKAKSVPSDRRPDWVVRERTSPEQALIYRLSGDYNPLHIDSAMGKALGFGTAILHGLATYGFAARAVIDAVAGGERRALRMIGVRFSAPVVPGDELETRMWEVGAGPQGTVEVAFETKDLSTGKVVLSRGVAYVRKAEKSKL